MLVRTTALALLFANCAYFGWSQGLFAPIGLAPSTPSEPQRMGQQIRPEALRVVPAAPAADAGTQAASAPPAPQAGGPVAPGPPAPPEAAGSGPQVPSGPAAPALPEAAPAACLQAGPFDTAQADVLRKALATAGVPPGAWALDPVVPPDRWIVYMGRYTDPELLERKRAELRALRVDTAPVTLASLSPGLSLGVFSSQESANEHLAQLTRRGVRTARVVAEHRTPTSARLRLPAADAALREQVQQLGPALSGRPLTPC